jgi:SAM-dependent methyltransferase
LSILDALTPARRRGEEILDDPSTPTDVRARAMADLVRSNAWFGGVAPVLHAMRRLRDTLPRDAVVLDVGTGLAEIPDQVRSELVASGALPHVVGMDAAESMARAARTRLGAAVVGDALRLPFRSASVDVVMCSQLLHHFETDAARAVLAELHRVSRGWVVVADLRRSWFSVAGFWLSSALLRFHPVTRHDGVVSILRGFTLRELEGLVRDATGVMPLTRPWLFWRVSATWRAGAE